MSDMAPQFYHAWVAVMDKRPAKLICTWHTDTAWQLELGRKIGDRVVEENIYKMLRTVLQETDQGTFQNILKAMINYLKVGATTKKFYEYFEKLWVPKKVQWAYC